MSEEPEEGCIRPFVEPQASMYGGNGSDHPFSVQFLCTLPIHMDKYTMHIYNNTAMLNDWLKNTTEPTFDS